MHYIFGQYSHLFMLFFVTLYIQGQDSSKSFRCTEMKLTLKISKQTNE